MGNAFGKKKPLKEILRENKRMINKAVRELDREKLALEREEKRLTIEIKKNAKAGQMKAVKIMAKDLVRTRQYVTKFIEMRSHLQASALKLQTVKSHQAMSEAMQTTAKAMMKMNKVVNVEGIHKMMAEFEKENMKSEMMQEMMTDAMDDAMDDDDGDDDQQVQLDELLDGLVLNDDEKKEEKIKEVFDEEAPWGLRNVVEEGEKAAEDGLKFVGREMARQVKDKDTATTVSTFGKDFMDKKFNFM